MSEQTIERSALALPDLSLEWISPRPSDLPTAERRRGRQQVAAFFKGVGQWRRWMSTTQRKKAPASARR